MLKPTRSAVRLSRFLIPTPCLGVGRGVVAYRAHRIGSSRLTFNLPAFDARLQHH